MSDDGPTIEHVLLLRWTDASTRDGLDRVVDGMESLFDGDPRVQRWEIARDLGLRPGHPTAADVLARVWFAGPGAFRAYLDSPAHRAFVDEHVGGGACTVSSLQRRSTS